MEGREGEGRLGLRWEVGRGEEGRREGGEKLRVVGTTLCEIINTPLPKSAWPGSRDLILLSKDELLPSQADVTSYLNDMFINKNKKSKYN